jgi:hypothetical protein
MKTTLTITAITSLTLIQSCSSSKETNSFSGKAEGEYYSRHLTPVIDGKMNEWGDTLLYDNATKCIYSIANDESALYIGIKATDRIQQMKMIQGGMEIFIDNKVKKNKSIGIKYPLGGGTVSTPGNRSNGQDLKEMQQQMKAQMLRMELIGFKEGLNGEQGIYSSTMVRPVMDWDNKDNLIYEVVIPFEALDESVKADLNDISIGIFINGLKVPQGAGGGMPSGGPPGGGGMRPVGRNDRSMPDQSEIENIMKENSFWTKYTISK